MGDEGNGGFDVRLIERARLPLRPAPMALTATLALALVGGIAGLLLALSGSPATAQDGGRQLVAAHSGLCLTVQGASMVPVAPVVQEPCTGAPSQAWTTVAVGGGWYRLEVAHSGQCLDVEGGSAADAARLIQYPCSGGANQQFRFEPTSTEPGRIIARHSNKCVNIFGAFTASGTRAIQWPCTSGAANELFTAVTAGGVDPARVGRWSPVLNLPLVPVAAANLPDGRVLTWSAYDRFNFGGDRGFTQTAIFDPTTATVTERRVSNTGHDMFCPGVANLPDGRILVNGGSSAAETSIYDPATDTWADGADMNIGRGYQGTTLTSNGSVFTLGGSWSGGIGGKSGELWTESGGWRRLSGVPVGPFRGTDPRGEYRDDNHLWLFGWKDGLVFHAGPSRQMNWIDTNGNGSVTPAGNRGADAYAMNGNAVMYAPGRILTVGGAPDYDTGVGTANATVIDINGPTVTSRTVAPLGNPRTLHHSVVLPNGEVIVAGGQARARLFTDERAVLTTEIWSPTTETFRSAAAMSVPRTYHSVALLQLDGRVLVGGGGLCGNCAANHPDVQIYSPPYLFNADGTDATRPRIITAPDAVDLDEVFTVTTNTAISEMVLVRMASSTHSVNNDQRRIPVTFTPGAANLAWNVTAPTDPGVAIPGLYMLFALDADGVPGVAKVVQVTSERADTTPGSISGTVTNGDDTPAAGVAVDLFAANPDGTRGAYLRSTTTGADGRYRFDADPGCHTITFVAPSGRRFTNGTPWSQATPCPGPGQAVTGVDARLTGGGNTGAAVTGTVTDLGGSPVAGVEADLFGALADGSRGAFLASTTTDGDGAYRFGVAAGCHTVTLIAPAGRTFTNASQWYNQGACPTPGQTLSVDARLTGGAAGTSVGGTVTDGSGSPVAGVAVDLFTANADGSRGAYLASTTTDSNGAHRFDTAAGCHVVTVIAPTGRTFANGNTWRNLTGCPTTGQTLAGLDARLN